MVAEKAILWYTCQNEQHAAKIGCHYMEVHQHLSLWQSFYTEQSIRHTMTCQAFTWWRISRLSKEGDHFYQPPQLIFIITITWSWPADFGWRTMVGPKIPVNPIREALIVRKGHPFLYHWYNKHSLSPFKYVHSFYSSLKWIYLQTIWTVTQQCRWYLSTTEGTSHFHLDILTIFVMS